MNTLSIQRPFPSMVSLKHFNRRKTYGDQVKPYNFVLASHVAPFGHPVGVTPQRFQLIAPYESNPTNCLRLTWNDIHTGKPYKTTTTGEPTDTTARVQTYRDVLQAYEHHPEVKSAAPDGSQADQGSVGLLGRLHVHELERVHIGKESNRLEDADAGDVHDLDEVLTGYDGPGTDAFTIWVLPILRRMSAKVIAERCDVSLSYAHRVKSGRVPIPRARDSLKRLALAAAAERGLPCEQTASLHDICGRIAEATSYCVAWWASYSNQAGKRARDSDARPGAAAASRMAP